MWIVRLALRRPYTIAVFCLLIFLGGILSIKSMLIDIFPVIDIPVVGIVWSYPGLSADNFEKRVTLYSERSITTTVNGVAKIESVTMAGVGLVKVYFQPGINIGAAIAQISAASSSVLRLMPPGMQPPAIVQSNASSVPVAQLTVFSDSLPEEKLFDYGLNFIRLRLFTVPGLATPAPYGGKNRQINVDVNPVVLNAKGLSSYDVVAALTTSNIILPSGSARIGLFDYDIALNSSPEAIDEFKKIPIRAVGPQVITIGDVAEVKDAFTDQTNIVRVNGKRATYLNIMKKADASTLSVVDLTRQAIPLIKATAPPDLNLKLDFDQSVFVRAAIGSVLHEAVLSSVLVSLMILLFLGSWTNVFIVCTSIPLSILCAIIGLKLTGNSINIMTLGGMSLAIGMLVDDATVAVENIHRNRTLGLPLTRAILVGAQQIALPAIMATLAICIVFFPVVLITGPAKFLFTPMALSVVFAMMASYVLSRTLVPLLTRLMVKNETMEGEHDRFPRFVKMFSRLEKSYHGLLAVFLKNRPFVLWTSLGALIVSLMTLFVIGRDFFPVSDTGLMKIHFRAPSGTRIEETEKLIVEVEKQIRAIVPADEIETINVVIGVPTYFNLAFVSTDNVNGGDAEIFVALKHGHRATNYYVKKIRTKLNENFPGSSIYFQPADIVSQVINFGVSAPIDVQIEGADIKKSYEIAQQLLPKIKTIPGAVDVTLKQAFDLPTLKMNVDRVRAAQVGVTQRDVANSMLITLSGSSMVAPSFYLNPTNNVSYPVVVKVPMVELSSMNDLLVTPVTPLTGGSTSPGQNPTLPSQQAPTQRLGNLVSMSTATAMSSINHVNVQRNLDITANVEGRDLGSVSKAIEKSIASLRELPPGTKITVRGQGEVMNSSFKSLGLGLIVAMFLVYLLMVVLFQSFMDPFIVMVAVPGALVGILWMLLLTGTTINVSSFMGSIMAVGIAASNSILMVNFANDLRVDKGLSPLDAALEAGVTRLRPILMTAIAMILGMLPSALALGEGGEQNAPLGRAVIGGLLVATFVTLFIVPVIYSILRIDMPEKHKLDEKLMLEEQEGLV